MVEPHLAAPEAPSAREVLSRDDALAIGRPGGAIEEPVALFGDLGGFSALGGHHPDVVAAPFVTRKGDKAPIRAKARLHVPGEAVGERLGLPAVDGQEVEVPQEVEDDVFTIRAHIQAHPGPRRHLNRLLARRDLRLLNVPRAFVGLGLALCLARYVGLGSVIARPLVTRGLRRLG